MNELTSFLAERAKLQPAAAEYIDELIPRLDGSALLDEAWHLVLEKGEAAAYLDSHAAEYGCEPNRLKLAVCLLLTRNMLEEYRRNGYDERIYTDSLADIPIWAECCRKDTGLWGMKQFSWLANTLRAKLWRLGRLEFERVHFEAEHYEKDGISLKEGDGVINVHIPEGSPLTPAVVDDAFDRAVRFFGSNVFVCESWMLWPTHRDILPASGNILSFQNRFDLVDSWSNAENGDLWRIFGYLKDFSPEKLPRETGLQRAYADELMRNGGLTGGGYGVYVHHPKTEA